MVIKTGKKKKTVCSSSIYIRDLNLAPIRFVQFVPRFFLRCPLYSFIISMFTQAYLAHAQTNFPAALITLLMLLVVWLCVYLFKCLVEVWLCVFYLNACYLITVTGSMAVCISL